MSAVLLGAALLLSGCSDRKETVEELLKKTAELSTLQIRSHITGIEAADKPDRPANRLSASQVDISQTAFWWHRDGEDLTLLDLPPALFIQSGDRRVTFEKAEDRYTVTALSDRKEGTDLTVLSTILFDNPAFSLSISPLEHPELYQGEWQGSDYILTADVQNHQEELEKLAGTDCLVQEDVWTFTCSTRLEKAKHTMQVTWLDEGIRREEDLEQTVTFDVKPTANVQAIHTLADKAEPGKSYTLKTPLFENPTDQNERS